MQNNKQQERTLSYTLAQKLDEADIKKVSGGFGQLKGPTGHCDPNGVCDFRYDF